jgi:putative copper resistance protein D
MNHIHFVLVGCLWFWPLLGRDPMPRVFPFPLRMVSVFATLPFHAWLGIALMSSTTVIAADWYEGLGRTWGASPLSDQHTAGGILWASGDIVGLVLFAILFVQWAREAQREAARVDRHLDRLEAQAAARSRATGGSAADAHSGGPGPGNGSRRDCAPGLPSTPVYGQPHDSNHP